MVFGSEVFAKYRKWELYAQFRDEVSEALEEMARASNFFSDTNVAALHAVVQKYLTKEGFHHVITEIAFLEISMHDIKDETSYDDQRQSEALHRVIPLLLNGDPVDCFQRILGSETTIRIKDPSWDMQSETTRIHRTFFKLLSRLLDKDASKLVQSAEELGYIACLGMQRIPNDEEQRLSMINTQLMKLQQHIINHDSHSLRRLISASYISSLSQKVGLDITQ
jgi:hypothetical protein